MSARVQSISRIAFAVVLVLVALALTWKIPSYDQKTDPVVTRAEMGAPVRARTWSVTIGGLRVARSVKTELDERTTDGRFVVVDGWVHDVHESISAPEVGLRASDGTTWWQTSRVSSTSTMEGEAVPPGFAVRGSWVVEIPAKAQVKTLLVALRADPVLDDQLEIRVDSLPKPVASITIEAPVRGVE